MPLLGRLPRVAVLSCLSTEFLGSLRNTPVDALSRSPPV